MTASLFLPYPGIQNDEALFADPLYRPDAVFYRIGIFGHSLPLMHLTYLGTLKTWLYAPILALWQPSWASVRIPAVLLGAATVALFFWLLHAAHGARAAWTGGLLLATDTLFVLTTSFDWGPVVLQHLLLVAGLVALVQFHRTGGMGALGLGWFCFGLGMWDKALFAWTLGGVAVAGGFVFHRELWKRLTWRNAALAGAAFCLGALPLIAYNLNANLVTARSNASITPDYFSAKWEMLRGTWAGTGLFGYVVNHDTAERPRPPSGPLETAAFRVRSVFGEHRTNRLEAAAILALLLLPLLWFTPARRTLLFSLLAFVVAWLQMALTKNAGLAAHHTVLLWPLAYLFLAVAFAEASLHVGRAGRWLLAAGVLYLVASNLLLTNQYFYQIARDGPAGSWTDAIFTLSDRVGGLGSRPLLVTDWGILNPLEVLHQGRLNLKWAGDVDPALFADGEALWMDHTVGNEQFQGRNKLWSDAAAAAGYRKVVVETVPDHNGRPIFELFRWVRGAALPGGAGPPGPAVRARTSRPGGRLRGGSPALHNELVEPFTFEQARACVLVRARGKPATEDTALLDASGRVLAETVTADRDYPPVARSVRDGFAVRAADLPGELRVIGEIRAGEPAQMEVHPGETVEIMTGAPMPRGADAVVMVEHTSADDGRMTTQRSHRAGDNVNPRASEARAGDVLLTPGTRLGFPEIALLAMLGRPCVSVYRRPHVAIVSTGDEVVEIGDRPSDFQVRNSNAYSLAAQVKRAGGCPRMLPIAKDLYESTRELVERGLECDLLLLSGGVSAGKYDLVERVLADLDAEFFFNRVLIQPGQPLVFGGARGKLFFGLPGNPASTMVTYEVFGRSAQELLEGQADAPLPITWGRLTIDFRQKPGLTRFLPAQIGGDGDVTPTGWTGSGDIPALARANAFLMTEPERESWSAGEMIRVLPR